MKSASRAFWMPLLVAALTISLFNIAFSQRAAETRSVDGGRATSQLTPFKQKRIDADQSAVSSIKYAEMIPQAPDALAANPLIYAYDFSTDHLVSFNAQTPGTIVNDIAIIGLDTNNNEYVESMDYRASTGTLYGIVLSPLNNNERLVTINTTTGQLTNVGGTFTLGTGLFYGGDVNPVTSTYRLVDEARENMRISLTTGAVTATDPSLTFAAGDVNAARQPDISNIAFTNNTPGATQTTLYGIDSGADALVRFGTANTTSPGDTGVVSTIGALGTDVVHFGGFDIQQGTGLAYAALKGPGAAVSSLYQINLATGAATLIGAIGQNGDNIDGLALSYSPNGGSADLSITKTDNKTSYAPGGTNTYVITATNAGPDPVVGTSITDTFPAGISSGAWTCTSTGGATCPSANGNGNISSLVDIPANGTVTFTVTANIAAGATGNLVNTATITAPAGVADANAANNSATDTDVSSAADLAITKTDNTGTYTAGGSTTYVIVASNNGPAAVTGATVADTLPASIGSASWTCTGAGGGTCPAANGNGNINAAVNLPSGGSVTYTVAANISAGVAGNLVNTATITAPAGITDPTPANNTATDTDTIAGAANVDVSVTVTDNRTTYSAGGTNTYTLVASNAGPTTATGATLTDAFSGATTSSVSFTCVGAGGATCPAANGNGNINTPVTLPTGGSLTYTIAATTAANASGNLVNTAGITAPAGTTDTNPANNNAVDTDTLAQVSTDLSITKTDNKATYSPGGTAVYTIVATNSGPDPAIGAVVTDTMPSQVSGDGWTCTASVGATCPSANGSGNISATVNIPSGGTVTFTLTTTISQAAAGNMANTATVTAGPGANDPNAANNSATDTDTLQPTAGTVVVSGRVIDPSGRGLRSATVTISDSAGVMRTVITSSLGFYQFDVEAGSTYIIGVSSKKYRFTSRAVQITDSLADINFVGQE